MVWIATAKLAGAKVSSTSVALNVIAVLPAYNAGRLKPVEALRHE